MRVHSRVYLLEFRCDLAGKFLKLSVTKEGYRTFVIFPAGWNDKGWGRIFTAIKDIVGQSSVEPNVNPKGNGYQLLKAKRGDVGAPPPPPPLGCCPHCGFRCEPACFLRSFASALSPVPFNKNAGSSAQGISPDKPCSSVEAHGLVGTHALPIMFANTLGNFGDLSTIRCMLGDALWV